MIVFPFFIKRYKLIFFKSFRMIPAIIPQRNILPSHVTLEITAACCTKNLYSTAEPHGSPRRSSYRF